MPDSHLGMFADNKHTQDQCLSVFPGIRETIYLLICHQGELTAVHLGPILA